MTKELQTKEKLPPGDFGIWIIVYVELITFGLLFVGYAFARRLDVALFNESQLLLDTRFGFVNTLILVTSSYFVVKALESIKIKAKKEASALASKWLLFAMGLGLVFIVNKIIEFSQKSAQGIDLSTNTFFMFYILLTAFHFLHMILGVVILFNVRQNTKRGAYSYENYLGMQTGAIYWHLIDLLWIVLFAVIYIIR